ncbi:MAG TPA: hypothetical protein VMG10_32040 [Gemmataceae bacterium]|nr:hypothetical protein [Gemmataceae bacterium]
MSDYSVCLSTPVRASHWTAEFKTLFGLLKMVPSGSVRNSVQKVVNDAWTAVEAKLKAPVAGD